MSSVTEIVRRQCREMNPRPTATASEINHLPGIRAVMFDIYGTLLISGAGDISLQTETSNDDAFREALVQCGFKRKTIAHLSANLLKRTITEHQAAKRKLGIEYPEVDIVAVWKSVTEKIFSEVGNVQAQVDASQLATEYEVRVNPVWPMPGMLECIQYLRGNGLLLGVISNAQAMTRQLFPALFDQTLEQLGFANDLQFYSYLIGESKPGRAIFTAAVSALADRGMTPDQAVFVGNDALNDVWAADQLGFRTILFAGDERSLRLRADDERLKECTPDAVVTHLLSIPDCLQP